MSDFWVDTGGLAKSAEGFQVRGRVIASLAARIDALMGPEAAAALGDDSEGQALLAQLRSEGEDLRRGVGSWGEAVEGTGAAVVQAAHLFAGTEESNTQAARTFTAGTGTGIDLPTIETPGRTGGGSQTTTPTTTTTPRVH